MNERKQVLHSSQEDVGISDEMWEFLMKYGKAFGDRLSATCGS